MASDSTVAAKDIEQIIQEFCKDIDNTVRNIKEMQEKMINQMKAVMIVGQTFDKLEEMNSKTTSFRLIYSVQRYTFSSPFSI